MAPENLFFCTAMAGEAANSVNYFVKSNSQWRIKHQISRWALLRYHGTFKIFCIVLYCMFLFIHTSVSVSTWLLEAAAVPSSLEVQELPFSERFVCLGCSSFKLTNGLWKTIRQCLKSVDLKALKRVSKVPKAIMSTMQRSSDHPSQFQIRGNTQNGHNSGTPAASPHDNVLRNQGPTEVNEKFRHPSGTFPEICIIV